MPAHPCPHCGWRISSLPKHGRCPSCGKPLPSEVQQGLPEPPPPPVPPPLEYVPFLTDSIVEHPIFGKIGKDRFQWTCSTQPSHCTAWIGRIRLDFFAGCDFKGHSEPQVRGYKQGDFDLLLITSKNSTPTSSQERAFRDFLDNREIVSNAVLEAIWNYFCETYGVDPLEYDVPIPQSRDGLKESIRFSILSVLDDPANDGAVVGFRFECSWDVEHHLGVLVRGLKVIEVAGE
jgi:hypothetical protein